MAVVALGSVVVVAMFLALRNTWAARALRRVIKGRSPAEGVCGGRCDPPWYEWKKTGWRSGYWGCARCGSEIKWDTLARTVVCDDEDKARTD